MDASQLNESQKSRLNNLQVIQFGIISAGQITGLFLANKAGGGFWRYAGYFILGGLVVGVPTLIAMTPLKNKILKENEIK